MHIYIFLITEIENIFILYFFILSHVVLFSEEQYVKIIECNFKKNASMIMLWYVMLYDEAPQSAQCAYSQYCKEKKRLNENDCCFFFICNVSLRMLNIIAHIELFYVSLLLFWVCYTHKYICRFWCEKQNDEKLSSIHLYWWISSFL